MSLVRWEISPVLESFLKLLHGVMETTESYPTPENVDDWDDASLLATIGFESAIRYRKQGFEALNPTERVVCCFCLLESEINNGGVGQWISNLCPQSAIETLRALKEIGATEMAAFLTEVLRSLGDPAAIPSQSTWVLQYMSMPDTVHEKWETLTPQYLALECGFLKMAYGYAREHWKNARRITTMA